MVHVEMLAVTNPLTIVLPHIPGGFVVAFERVSCISSFPNLLDKTLPEVCLDLVDSIPNERFAGVVPVAEIAHIQTMT